MRPARGPRRRRPGATASSRAQARRARARPPTWHGSNAPRRRGGRRGPAPCRAGSAGRCGAGTGGSEARDAGPGPRPASRRATPAAARTPACGQTPLAAGNRPRPWKDSARRRQRVPRNRLEALPPTFRHRVRYAPSMDARLADFVGLLRQNGLRVSPAEVADAARAAVLIGLEQRAPFRAALRATLVKRGPDAPVFDRLFDLYFLGVKDLVEGLSGSLLDALAAEKLTELDLEEAARMLAQMQLSPLTDALVKGRADQLARLLRQATLSLDFRGLQSPLQRGFYARRLLQAAGGTEAEKELRQFLQTLRERGLDPAQLELASRQVSHTLQALEEAARRVADREQKARDPESRGDKSLLHRSMASLTPDEVQRMRTVVRRLAERLKARLSRRRKVRRRGKLSVRRTLRKNLSTGREPYKLVFRARRPERPEIVVLCDVSDSVRNV